MTDASRAARILHGIERILDERTTPIPPRVMQQALRVVRGALEGPMTAERCAVEAAIREPAPAPAARRGRPSKSPQEKLAAKRARQAAWKREKLARLKATAAPAAAPAEVAAAVVLIQQPRQAGKSAAVAEQLAGAPVGAMPVVPAQMVPAPQLPRLATTLPSPEQRREEEDRVARLVRLRHMASWLRAERDRQGLTATTLAAAIGLPSSVLGNLLGKSTATSECTRVCAVWLDRHAPGWRDAAPPASVAASSTPNAPKPPAIGQLEPVPASMKDAEDWLYEEIVRERGKRANHAEIEARIAMFTPEGLLREVNPRRLRHGLPPYVLSGRAA